MRIIVKSGNKKSVFFSKSVNKYFKKLIFIEIEVK